MSKLALEGKRYEFHGLKLPVLFFSPSPLLFSRVAAVRDSCVTPYLDASDRCNRQFEERKRLRNEGYESPSEKSVSTYTGEL